jgi:hypothetical protein
MATGTGLVISDDSPIRLRWISFNSLALASGLSQDSRLLDDTLMEIDDRGECVLVDAEILRMLMYGQVFSACGLFNKIALKRPCGAEHLIHQAVH